MLAGCSLWSEPRLSSEDTRLKITPPKTAVTYTADLQGDLDEETTQLIKDSLILFRQQDGGAPSPGHLRQRAAAGLETVAKIMRSRGYYESTANFEITPQDEDSKEMQVILTVQPNTQFILKQFGLKYLTSGTQPTPKIPETIKRLPVNQPAVAADIVAVEARITQWLLDNGYPYAEFLSRDVVADMEAHTLSVSSVFETGPRVTYGDVVFEGTTRVKEDYLQSYIPWSTQTHISEAGIAAYQRNLSSTQLFDAVAVKVPKPAPKVTGSAPEPVPITVIVEEAKFRTFGIGGRFSTDIGPIVRFGFEHRNLFDANETLTFELDGGIEYQQLVSTYIKPQFKRAGQDLTASFTVLRELTDEFDQNTATLTAGLKRELSPKLSVGLGGLVEYAAIDDGEEDINSYLFGVPGFAEYNDFDNVLNPTQGLRGRVSITPFLGSYDELAHFLVLDGQMATYFSLDQDKDYVLALRGRLASILGLERDDVPLNRRLYAGGGGSVRGYELRSVGPLDDDDDAQGGTSAVELSAEMRMKVTKSIGIVPFVDAGLVGEQPWISSDADLQYAAGLGFRYFTAIGPIRADVAIPLDKRERDPAYQLYISIGQAF